MDAIEGRRVGGQLDEGLNSHEGREVAGRKSNPKTDPKSDPLDRLASLLALARKDSGSWEDRGGNEFDGIRSEVDFRRAMALEEERLRGSWSQRFARALNALSATFWNSRALRLLR
jgi:hypothetical protein